MSASNSARVYPAPMRALHWATAGLLAAAYPAAWAIGSAASVAEAERTAGLHRTLGLLMLAVTVVRAAVRLREARRGGIPALPATLPLPQRLAARAVAAALYCALLAQPGLGLAGSLLHGGPVLLVAGAVVPPLLSRDRPLAHLAFRAHGALGLLLLALIGLHVAAALHHRFIRRDDVAEAMLPAPRRRAAPALAVLRGGGS